jgi:hypothetical protein
MADAPGRFRFGDRTIEFTPGQSIGAALWKAGVRSFRSTRRFGRPRAIYCGIGQCFDCLVRVNDTAVVRACVTDARDGDGVTPGDADVGGGHD